MIAPQAGVGQHHVRVGPAAVERPVQQRIADVAGDLRTELRRALQPGQDLPVVLERRHRLGRPLLTGRRDGRVKQVLQIRRRVGALQIKEERIVRRGTVGLQNS